MPNRSAQVCIWKSCASFVRGAARKLQRTARDRHS